MFFPTSFLLVSALALLKTVGAQDANVITAERIYHTIIPESPYLVDRTTTVVWTQGPSISDTETTAPTETATAY
ncbi:hypothetical protein FPV67DRAFT_400248 [Lyophyllum atratum]|nr:hypothetical protein FPV67DRAFT_400248 [Lyophyllum atratum]